MSEPSVDLQEQSAVPDSRRPEGFQSPGRRAAWSQGLPGGAGVDRGFAGGPRSNCPLHIAKHRQLSVRVLCARSGSHPRRSVPAASVHVSARAGIAVLSQVQVDNEFGHRKVELEVCLDAC